MDISAVTSPSLQSLLASQPPAPASPAAASALTAAQASPAVQQQSLLASSESLLLSSLGGGGSALPDLSGFVPTAQAYSLYTNPTLLQQLATPPASANATASSGAGAVNTAPAYSFNPFDEASWWTDPGASLGATVDASA